MKNKLSDLNEHLFLALERVNDEDIDTETLDKEIQRSKAVIGIASQIIANGNLVLRAKIAQSEMGMSNTTLPTMLEG